MKHYHVIAGLRGGYIPNSNEVYTSKRDALQGARFILDGYRDAGEAIKGSARSGYWIARKSETLPDTYWDYVEIGDACYDPEHDPATWDWEG